MSFSILNPGYSEQEQIDDLATGLASANAAIEKLNPSALTSSQTIKAVAVNSTYCPVPSVRWFDMENAATSDLPYASMKYSEARVIRRTNNIATVDLYADNGRHHFVCSTTNGGSTWGDWEEIALKSDITFTSLGSYSSSGIDPDNYFTHSGQLHCYIPAAKSPSGSNEYGFLLAFVADTNNGAQLFIGGSKVYARRKNNGTIGSWMALN